MSPGFLPASEKVRDLRVHWGDTNWSAAVPTKNASWFLSIAPQAAKIEEGSTIALRGENFEVPGTVVHFDPSHRLCLIETPEPLEGFAAAKLAKFPLPNAGQKLHCSLPGSSSPSTVAGTEFNLRGEPLSSPLLKVRVADGEEFCHPGTPLVCGNGYLFGILTEVMSFEAGEAFAVPASCLRKVVSEYERFEKTGRVWIGLVFEDQAQTPQVIEVRAGSPAEKAGVEVGDVVLGVGGHSVRDLDDLTQTVHLLIAGEPVELTVLRGVKKVKLQLTPRFADTEIVATRP
ncbi:MAG: PDZ domain-containing protein [Verrucomicrobiota bacterium]